MHDFQKNLSDNNIIFIPVQFMILACIDFTIIFPICLLHIQLKLKKNAYQLQMPMTLNSCAHFKAAKSITFRDLLLLHLCHFWHSRVMKNGPLIAELSLGQASIQKNADTVAQLETRFKARFGYCYFSWMFSSEE